MAWSSSAAIKAFRSRAWDDNRQADQDAASDRYPAQQHRAGRG